MAAKPLHSSFVTVIDGTLKPGFKPQYCACLFGSTTGNVRIEFYKSQEDASMGKTPPRVAPIKPQCTIAVNHDKCSFTTGKTTVVTHSPNDLKLWTTCIYQAQPTVKGLSGVATQMYEVVTDPRNDLGPFMVTLQQSNNLSFYGPCQVEIQPQMDNKVYCVAVYDLNQPPRLIIKWQIDHLRGYGSNDSILKIQTGRRTTTGIGEFIFQTTEGDRIHKGIHFWAEEISKSSPAVPSGAPASRVGRNFSANHKAIPDLPPKPLLSGSMTQNSAYDSIIMAGKLPASNYATFNDGPKSSTDQPASKSNYELIDTSKRQSKSTYATFSSPTSPTDTYEVSTTSSTNYTGLHRDTSTDPEPYAGLAELTRTNDVNGASAYETLDSQKKKGSSEYSTLQDTTMNKNPSSYVKLSHSPSTH